MIPDPVRFVDGRGLRPVIVESGGIEPPAYALPVRRSPNALTPGFTVWNGPRGLAARRGESYLQRVSGFLRRSVEPGKTGTMNLTANDCPTCHGDGVVEISNPESPGQGRVSVDCERCGGTGCLLKCMRCGGAVPDLGPLKTPYECESCRGQA